MENKNVNKNLEQLLAPFEPWGYSVVRNEETTNEFFNRRSAVNKKRRFKGQ
jgi:hypothetical protein